MKKENVVRYLGLFLMLIVVMVPVIGMIDPDLAESIIGFLGISGSSTMLLANTPILGTQTREKTQDQSPDHIKRHVSDVVTEMRPDEFPLDTMVRSIRKSEKAKEVKVEFETVKFREWNATTTELFTAEADATDQNVLLSVTNVNIFGKHDTILVPTIPGADGKPLRLFVMEVLNGSNEIRVTAVNSPTAASQRVPTIANSTGLVRLNTAKNELDSTTDVIAQEPTLDFNYAQIQMCFLEQSVLRGLLKSYSGYSHADKYVQEIYNMRSACEKTAMYGAKSRTINLLDNKVHYTADGIAQKIVNGHTYKGNATTVEVITHKDVTALLEKVFAANAGSDERLLLGGSTLIRRLQDVGLERHIGPTETRVVHGVKVLSLESNFGTLNIKHSKSMDIAGDKSNAYILDLKHIFKHDLESMGTKRLNPDDAGLRRVQDSVRILENSCVTLRYPDVHLKWTRDGANTVED